MAEIKAEEFHSNIAKIKKVLTLKIIKLIVEKNTTRCKNPDCGNCLDFINKEEFLKDIEKFSMTI